MLDTNILSNICKNRNAEKENFISRFIDKKYAPCIEFQSVLEIYNAEPKGKSPLFESFVEVFSEIPTLLPTKKSSDIPNIIPNIVPSVLPINNHIDNTNITNRLGFTPAKLNQEKKFACIR